MKFKRLTLSVVLAAGGFFSAAALADIFPYTPKVSLTGLGGGNASAEGEVLVPLLGDAGQLWYGNFQGRYGKSHSWSGSIGTGYRRIVNNAVWGGYLFADRNTSGWGHRYWLLSPGFERLGTRWDFRLNGYLPVQNKNWQGEWRPANEFGIPDYVKFSGHRLEDRLMSWADEVGRGLDAEVGYHVAQLPGLSLAGGLYHFRYKRLGNSITGVSGRLEYPVTDVISLVVKDSYDRKLGNEIGAGIKISFGGTVSAADNSSLAHRLTDEVKRGQGPVGRGSLMPVQSSLLTTDHRQVINENLWFFKAGVGTSNGAEGDGTFEHPFSGLQQSYVDKAGAGASLYMSSGEYGIGAPLDLYTGQTLHGRTQDFRLAAQNGQRPVIYNPLRINHQHNVTVDSIALVVQSGNNSLTNPAIAILNADHVLLNHVAVNGENIPTAVAIINSGKVVLNDADIELNYHAPEEELVKASGILIDSDKSSDITIAHSHILVNAGGDENTSAVGLDMAGSNNHVSVYDTTINAHAVSSGGLWGNRAVAYGIKFVPAEGSTGNQLIVSHSDITATAENTEHGAFAYGIHYDALNSSNLIKVTGASKINAQAYARSGGVAYATGINFIDLTSPQQPFHNELDVDGSAISSLAKSENGTVVALGIDIFHVQPLKLMLSHNAIKAGAKAGAQAQNGYAMGVLLSSHGSLDGMITDNAIQASASNNTSASNNSFAVARGIHVNIGSNQANTTKLSISHNTISAEAVSATRNVYSAGIFLRDGHPDTIRSIIISKNIISSIASTGKSDTDSKAYGIATNRLFDVSADNEIIVSGDNSTHKAITDDVEFFLINPDSLTVLWHTKKNTAAKKIIANFIQNN